MAITLDSLTLPPDLLWIDEFEWANAQGTAKRTIQGKQIIQAAGIPANSGRPVTLGNEHAWIVRSDLLTLQLWSGVPGKELLLTLPDGRAWQVVFRHWDLPVLQATPVFALADPVAGTKYQLLSLKLAVV